MEILSKETIKVDLTQLRDGLLSGVNKIFGMTEEEKAEYTNGILDMYNGFVAALRLKDGDETEVDLTIDTK